VLYAGGRQPYESRAGKATKRVADLAAEFVL
jgi:hypothetical protein